MEIQSTLIHKYDNDNIARPVSDDKRKEFESHVRPLIKFLNDNFNPHVKVIVETDGAEIVSGELSIKIKDYILD